jgi:predicted DNA binding CopG/RHH family protein
MAADAFVQCRVTSETKSRLAALARELGVTETQLVRGAIERMVAGHPQLAASAHEPRPALTRLSVRVRFDDRQLLADRAAARGMPPATYVGALVRSHLRHLAPLPSAELAALKAATAQVAVIGRNLNQYVQAVHSGKNAHGFTVEHAKTLIRVFEVMRTNVKDVIRANLASWESGHAE